MREMTWADAMVARYPHLWLATLEIAYDNGCVNRDRPEEQLLERWVAWCRDPDNAQNTYGQTPMLELAERELSLLSQTDMEAVCTGVETEQQHVLKRIGAVALNDVLTHIFEEVV